MDQAQTGTCHRYLAGRLKLAEAFLRQRHPGSDEHVRQKIGWNGSGGLAYENDAKFRNDTSDPMSHQHTMGLAIDIDPGNNPYIFQGGAGDSVFAKHLPIAARLFGGKAVTAGNMMLASNTSSTEELHGTIDKSSEAVRQYLLLGQKALDVIEEKLTKVYGPDKAKELAPSVKSFESWFHGGGGRAGAEELTSIKMDLLVALRDVAGLAWGGTEMSHTQNGDFMHFDCRNTELGHAVYAKLSPEEEKAQKQVEAARRKPKTTRRK